jgi:hypothetical protein
MWYEGRDEGWGGLESGRLVSPFEIREGIVDGVTGAGRW